MRDLLILVLFTTFVSQSLGASLVCPAGFQLMYKGACGIRISDGSTTYTYESASSLCYSMGGFLPSVHSNDENEALRVAAAGKTIILGLKSSNCKWEDGSPFDFDDYSGPNCSRGGVTMMTPENGKWIIDQQDFVLIDTVICKAPLKFDPHCGEFAAVDADASVCYDYHEEKLPWNEAEAACAKDGATIAVIHNQNMNDFIRRIAVSHGTSTAIHVGLSSTNGSDFKWADGTEMHYNNFAKQFPLPGLGDCALMLVDQRAGQWMNEPCDSKPMSFVCTRGVPKPVDDHCPNNYLYKNGDDIFSPGYPTHYTNQCDYMVIGGAGRKIRVEVIDFVLYPGANLTIYDGVYEDSTIATLTGEVAPTNFTSTQSSVMISWKSDDRQEMLGWHLRVFVDCGTTPVQPNLSTERIVGGQRAVPYSWPWQIVWCTSGWSGGCSLQCGGTVIDNRWVMNAGQCVYDDMNPKNYQVKAAVYKEDATSKSGDQMSNVKAIHLNPDYDPRTHSYDISLIELATPLKYSDHVQPICLPADDSAAISKPNSAYVTGFGTTTENNEVSIQLRQVKVPFVDYPTCEKEHSGKIIENTMVCAGVEGVDSCQEILAFPWPSRENPEDGSRSASFRGVGAAARRTRLEFIPACLLSVTSSLRRPAARSRANPSHKKSRGIG